MAQFQPSHHPIGCSSLPNGSTSEKGTRDLAQLVDLARVASIRGVAALRMVEDGDYPHGRALAMDFG